MFGIQDYKDINRSLKDDPTPYTLLQFDSHTCTISWVERSFSGVEGKFMTKLFLNNQLFPLFTHTSLHIVYWECGRRLLTMNYALWYVQPEAKNVSVYIPHSTVQIRLSYHWLRISLDWRRGTCLVASELGQGNFSSPLLYRPGQ